MGLITYFQDPKHPCMGPIRRYMQFFLILAEGRSRIKTAIFYLCYFLLVVLFVNQIAYLFIASQVYVPLKWVQWILLHAGILQIFCFFGFHSKWYSIFQRISKIECELLHDEVCRDRIKEYVKYNMKALLRFWSVLTCTTTSISFEAIYNTYVQVDMLDSVNDGFLYYVWWPFEYRRFWLYLVTAWKVLYFVVNISYLIGWYSFVVSLMICFDGQLDVVRLRFLHALDVKGDKEQRANLRKCYLHYLEIYQLFEESNSLVSPIMFINLLLFSCHVAAITLFNDESLLRFMEYLMTTLLTLLLVHWHGSEMDYRSQCVYTGVYESAWIGKSRAVRSTVLLLIGATTRRMAFSAGPLHDITLTTFVSLLRLAYSFYTFMSQTAKI